MNDNTEKVYVLGDAVTRSRGRSDIIVDPDANIPYGAVPEIVVNRVRPDNKNRSAYYRITGVLVHGDQRYAVSTVTTVFGENIKNGQRNVKKVAQAVKGMNGYQGDHVIKNIVHGFNVKSFQEPVRSLFLKGVSRTASLLNNMTGEDNIQIHRENSSYVNKDNKRISLNNSFIMARVTPAILDYTTKHRRNSNNKKFLARTVINMMKDKEQGGIKERTDNVLRYTIQWVVSQALLKNVDYQKYGTDIHTRRSIIGTMSSICCYCGEKADSADHVIPTSAGGPDILGNIVPACKSCNMEKSHVSVFDYIGFKPGTRVIATALGTVIDSKFSSLNPLNKAPVVAQIAASLF